MGMKVSRLEKIEARFASDTSDHALKVVRDDGLYRHISFGVPGSGIMRVNLVTWPGYLAYTGDMGAFVFSRVEDMFTFFRGRRVNPSYWAEKVQAECRDRVREWSRDLFAERARQDFDALVVEDDAGRWEGAEEDFVSEVLDGLDDKPKEIAYRDIIRFEHDGRLPFQDWYETDTDIFTCRFLWCCFAIVKAIAAYDDATAEGAS